MHKYFLSKSQFNKRSGYYDKNDKNLYNLNIIQVEIYKNCDKIYNDIIANLKKLKKVGG